MKEYSQNKAARIAGAAYFLIIITSILSMFFGPFRLIVTGDDHTTFRNLNEGLSILRAGAAYDLAMFTSVVLLVWALYVVLKPVHRDLAVLGMLWRMGEAVIGCMSVLCTSVVILLVSGADYPGLLGTARLESLVGLVLDANNAVHNILVPFFCAGTIVNCYLFLKARYIPRFISLWGIIASILMLGGGFTKILAPDSAMPVQMGAAGLVILFEVVIGVWLTTKGIKTHLNTV